MEQNIIDSSRYKISVYSLDSRFADARTSINSEFRVTNPHPIKNVIRIRLSSVEIPLVEHVFSADRGNISFSVSIWSGSPATITTFRSGLLPEGNYTNSTLCAAVQILLVAIHPAFLCSVDPISGFATIQNSSVQFSMDFRSPVPLIAARNTHWGLGYYLGFRSQLVNCIYTTATGYSMTGTSTIYVAPNPYYLLEIKCPDSIICVYHRIDNNAYVEAFSKVILKGNAYQIQFDDGTNLLRKEITFLAPVTIPYFQIRIVDPWGIQVNMLNNDWSVSLEITEVVNSKTYDTLLKSFNR